MDTRLILGWMAGTWLLATLAACSNDVPTGRRCTPGEDDCAATSTRDGGAHAGSGAAGTGNIDPSDNALSVHVEDIDKMTIEVITLACAGDCADIEAVAKGGNPAYHFKWEDGSTKAKRHVCLDASAKLSVSVTDTAIESEELGYEAQTVSSDVTATVLECAGDGGVFGTCSADAITLPAPGHYTGTLDCPAATSSGGAAGTMGTLSFDFNVDGTGTLFFQWSAVVIGADATVATPDCRDGDYHATYAGMWGVPGAADPNMPGVPPPILYTGPITGEFTIEAGSAPGTLMGIFNWDVPEFLNAEASICRGTFMAQLD